MKYLPERPNLLFLLREAKKLKSAHRNGDKKAIKRYSTRDFQFLMRNEW